MWSLDTGKTKKLVLKPKIFFFTFQVPLSLCSHAPPINQCKKNISVCVCMRPGYSKCDPNINMEGRFPNDLYLVEEKIMP
jgi:hypothetical protein